MAQRISFFFFSVFVAGRPATLQTGQSTVSYEEEDTVSYEEEGHVVSCYKCKEGRYCSVKRDLL